eukprot:Hpha_TRINITY_DN16890_c0_g1::TRINITY_DN16890_c0_g1_i8::g.153511::m.153511
MRWLPLVGSLLLLVPAASREVDLRAEVPTSVKGPKKVVKPRLGDAATCTGPEYCKCSPEECSYNDQDPCSWKYGFPGMELLGRAVDVSKYHSNLLETLTLGDHHTLAEAILPYSFFDQAPDFNLEFTQNHNCHYVRPSSQMEPTHVGMDSSSDAFSSSVLSSATASSFNIGFDVSVSLVSFGGSLSKKKSSSSSLSSFSGTATVLAKESTMELNPQATFGAGILGGLKDYDGSPAAKLQYGRLFKTVGFYFVSSVTTGGYYRLTQTVTKTAEADASQYAYDWKARVAFIKGSGGGGGSDQTDSYHRLETSKTVAVGGDDSYRAKLLSYTPVIQNETIDPAQWQTDFTNFFSTVSSNPVVVDMKVMHIRDRMEGGDQNPTVDNLRLAYDEIEQGLAADRIRLLRVQYGYDKSKFDTTAGSSPDARFIELPTELEGLPMNSQDNSGFSTQYDLEHSCASAEMDARNKVLGRTLRYTEHCDSSTNLIACAGLPWCPLLTPNNTGSTSDKSLNAEMWMRVTLVAGVGNDIQTIDFKPCGYGAVWAVYWNEHKPYSHNRTRQAKVVGPFYNSVEGGGKAQQLSDAAKDLFPCMPDNNMGGFTDGTDPACCDALSTNPSYIASQEVGCPADCSGHGECVFPIGGPLHCKCDPGFPTCGVPPPSTPAPITPIPPTPTPLTPRPQTPAPRTPSPPAPPPPLPTPLPLPTPPPTPAPPTPAPATDAEKLMQLVSRVSPTPSGWGGPGLCSGWAGVACSKQGEVRNLTLCTAGYSGTVDLTALPASVQRLELYSNNLSGTVDLTKLPPGIQEVNLYHNRFSGTPDLSALPSSLRLLDLRVNSFSGGGQFQASGPWCFTPQAQMCTGSLDAVFDCSKGSWECQQTRVLSVPQKRRARLRGREVVPVKSPATKADQNPSSC